ncbi:MAG: N-6 DNA methylase [Alphaproteobacteria bacterium]|nr:N-6 DNA methylase [Alphaproteobacteria bacterium]MCB9795374.1 N-6 DNA methylase [Alphaproteobacteria bacterium]
MNEAAAALQNYGAPAGSTVALSAADPRAAILYASILDPRSGIPELVAAVEVEGGTLALVADSLTCPLPEKRIAIIRRVLAQRGDVPFLVVVEPAQIGIYGVGLDGVDIHQALVKTVRILDGDAKSTFRRLELLSERATKPGQSIEDHLVGLLESTVGKLAHSMSNSDAITLAARALFVRFLLDRKIVTRADWSKISSSSSSPVEFFADGKRAVETCRWIEATFNDEFLALDSVSHDVLIELPSVVFSALSSVMYRTEDAQLSLDWAGLDFAHIPAGVLSQVYERLAEKFSPDRRKKESIYYTPARIARFVVSEVFDGIAQENLNPVHLAKVLDPCVGGGVFLVSAFQALVEWSWRTRRVRPDTQELRRILYEQLYGLDINPSALSLTALSLYLTAIELDPNPIPVEKLAFAPLLGRTLQRVNAGPGKKVELGSIAALGPDIKFDVVFSNPPWTALKGPDAKKGIADALKGTFSRTGISTAYDNPDNVPDVPIFLRAFDWVRPGGWVAMALHARLLYKTSKTGVSARVALFNARAVTGVVSGANVSQTQVWPGVGVPFCLLFARNIPRSQGQVLQFCAPARDRALNSTGRWRFDPDSTHHVAIDIIERNPYVFKVLTVGSQLDYAILARLTHGDDFTPLAMWLKGHELKFCSGFIVGKPENRTYDSSMLLNKPMLTKRQDIGSGFDVPTEKLPNVDEARMQWRRDPDIYNGPILLVKERFPIDRREWVALLSADEVVYAESFHGISFAQAPESRKYINLLFCLLHSQALRWFVLTTSGKYGIQRGVVEQQDLKRFPIPHKIDVGLLKRADSIVDSLRKTPQDDTVWRELDSLCFDVWGLNTHDIQVLWDTLSTGLPESTATALAAKMPTEQQMLEFRNALVEHLQPFYLPTQLVARPVRLPEASPWRVVCITTDDRSSSIEGLSRTLDGVLGVGVSRVVLDAGNGYLLFGALAQYRYWTLTKARLAALEILSHYSEWVD